MVENGFLLSSETVFDLIQSVYRSADTFAADFAQEYPSLAALSERLGDIRKRPGSLFLVVREGSELLGYLFIVPRMAAKLRHTADLNMGMRAEARGRGLGGALCKAAQSQLRRDRIIEIVYLMVRADNDPAIQLYKNYGFEELALLKQDTKVAERYYDGVLMRLRVKREV
jgi:ribosomal protein S18 acetylase RimI-like enzyme